jgi:hypothetical protein
MARELVYGCQGGEGTVAKPVIIGAVERAKPGDEAVAAAPERGE